MASDLIELGRTRHARRPTLGRKTGDKDGSRALELAFTTAATLGAGAAAYFLANKTADPDEPAVARAAAGAGVLAFGFMALGGVAKIVFGD